ncbi:MAG: hypothetical protein OXF49_00650 [Candidatus Saccharibacteria bacterium]|nr:hypothetical protein [Candidatus Saccharibacteria bacterium]
MKGLNQSGELSTGIWIAIIISVVLFIGVVVSLGLFITNNEDNQEVSDTDITVNVNTSDDAEENKATPSDSSTDTDIIESENQVDTTSSTNQDESSISSPVLESGNYTAEKGWDLKPICDNESFPSKAVRQSKTGKVVENFARYVDQYSPEYKYARGINTSYEFRKDFGITSFTDEPEARDHLVADLVVCIDETNEQVFKNTCSADDGDFTFIGRKFNVTIYNIHQKRKIAQTVIEASRECPRFFAVVNQDNQASSQNVDLNTLINFLKSKLG